MDALHAHKLQEYLLNVSRVIYSDQLRIVRSSSHNTSAALPFQRGVKQLCHLSQGLLNAILQFVMERWEQLIHDLGIGLDVTIIFFLMSVLLLIFWC